MKETEFNDVLNLMRLQNVCISQVSKFIYLLYADLSFSDNTAFREFTEHFHVFMQNHASSEGFSKALEMVQSYNYFLLDKLLSSEVLAAAEQLELAISHLELVERVQQVGLNPQLLLLNHSINFLEETQLKIIESLEKLLENYHQKQLQN